MKDWIEDCCQSRKTQLIDKLAEDWIQLVNELRENKIAHGDLQHGNILVTTSNELRLVDYDGMCVPDLVGEEALEAGLSGYQHPVRSPETALNLSLELDNFSAIIVYVCLKAIAGNSSLFNKDEHEYGLLFSLEDFLNPNQSSIFNDLKKNSDESISKWTHKIIELLKETNLDKIPCLQNFLQDFEEIKELLDQQEYDEAVELFNQSPSMSLPPDVKKSLNFAQRCVRLKKDLEEAESQGDERRMSELYDSGLLAKYPAAKRIASIAQSASKVAPIIEKLNQAISANQCDEIVKIWDHNSATLQGRTSAEKHRDTIANCRQRNKLRTDILTELKKASDDPSPRLKSLYDELHRLEDTPISSNGFQTSKISLIKINV